MFIYVVIYLGIYVIINIISDKKHRSYYISSFEVCNW